MNEGCKTLPVYRRRKNGLHDDADVVAIEEPLEIRIAGKPVCVTMRTPGHDCDLTLGFLFTEGVISGANLPKVRQDGRNRVEVTAAKTVAAAGARRLQSRFFVSSSCGLCGRTTAKQIRRRLGAINTDQTLRIAILEGLTAKLFSRQETFRITGGLHAAGLFDVEGNMLVSREDVGRHNAVDKAIGAWIREPVPDRQPVGLLVSGRASFEIVQKALAAKLPFVAAVSAPSSLAVELAREAEITLIAFLRGKTFNVYSRADRVRKK